MIIDTLEGAPDYSFGEAWNRTVAYLRRLPADVADGRYAIDGEDIFAIVMSYSTRTPEEGVLETHRKYVDVQAVLAGRERCAWYPRQGLETTDPYSAEKDAEFYRPSGVPPVEFQLSPGFFALFLPGDAHMTSLRVGEGGEGVKKVVVKIRVDLVRI